MLPKNHFRFRQVSVECIPSTAICISASGAISGLLFWSQTPLNIRVSWGHKGAARENLQKTGIRELAIRGGCGEPGQREEHPSPCQTESAPCLFSSAPLHEPEVCQMPALVVGEGHSLQLIGLHCCGLGFAVFSSCRKGLLGNPFCCLVL